MDDAEIEEGLSRTGGSCQVIRRVLRLVAVVFCSGWIASMAIIVSRYQELGFAAMLSLLAYVIAYGSLVAMFLYNLTRIFSDVAEGETPFSQAQVLRFKNLALAPLLLFVLDVLFSLGAVYEVVPLSGYSLVINDGITEPTINLNIGMLVFSAIMYSLSVIFRYAALLQQLSDDTV